MVPHTVIDAWKARQETKAAESVAQSEGVGFLVAIRLHCVVLLVLQFAS